LQGTGAWLGQARPQLGVLALVVIFNLLVAPGFLEIAVREGRLYGSLIDILNRGAPVALLAVGMALVIATRGIDLSVGAVMAIAGAVAAVAVNGGQHWTAAVALALGAGLACGLWNGVLVAVLNIQPIIATLILMVAGRGLAQLITEGRIVTFVEPHLVALGGGAVLGLPTPVFVLAAMAALTIALTRFSALGLFIEAVGVNPRASWLVGVNTRLVLIAVYVWSGLTAAIAGVLVAGSIRGADANNAGLWLELDAILAVVVGGGALLGGRFSIGLAVLAALSLQGLRTGVLRAGLPPELNLVVMAMLVAVVLVLQAPVTARALGRLKLARRTAS
jgi:simple sugar transport system permease protein